MVTADPTNPEAGEKELIDGWAKHFNTEINGNKENKIFFIDDMVAGSI